MVAFLETNACLFPGDAWLAVTGSAKIKVYDRDCIERGESLQGDMYIRDQRNTKGHVSPATHGQWHPTDRCARLIWLLHGCSEGVRHLCMGNGVMGGPTSPSHNRHAAVCATTLPPAQCLNWET